MKQYQDQLHPIITHKIIVIKYGGNAMIDDGVKNEMMQKIALLHHSGAKVVVVHGGGPQINAMLETLGVEKKFIDGYRYSGRDTVDAVDMVLGGTVNQDIVSALNSHNCLAVGLTGKDAKQFTIAPKTVPSGESLGYVGDITHVDTTLMHLLLDNGYVVVVAPPSADGTVGYNVNADTAAGAVAGALQADYFMALTNVAGIMDENKNIVAKMTVADIQSFIASGVINGGMLPKAQALIDALEGGVQNIVVADGTQPHAMVDVILNGDNGTLISP